MAALLVTGDLSVQGNIKGLRSLVEPLQVAMDNGAPLTLKLVGGTAVPLTGNLGERGFCLPRRAPVTASLHHQLSCR